MSRLKVYYPQVSINIGDKSNAIIVHGPRHALHTQEKGQFPRTGVRKETTPLEMRCRLRWTPDASRGGRRGKKKTESRLEEEEEEEEISLPPCSLPAPSLSQSGETCILLASHTVRTGRGGGGKARETSVGK